jgi:hypothetical protein
MKVLVFALAIFFLVTGLGILYAGEVVSCPPPPGYHNYGHRYYPPYYYSYWRDYRPYNYPGYYRYQPYYYYPPVTTSVTTTTNRGYVTEEVMY